MNHEEMKNLLEDLKKRKESAVDFSEKISIASEIHNIEMKLNGVKPMDSHIDCIGCGS
jgi:polyhydroxyalkanoate synthesis regulator phasin|tara:strand:+ start:1358 stop:1531 length:174 start_codon:yes stop_codon:yes gene_type:complete